MISTTTFKVAAKVLGVTAPIHAIAYAMIGPVPLLSLHLWAAAGVILASLIASSRDEVRAAVAGLREKVSDLELKQEVMHKSSQSALQDAVYQGRITGLAADLSDLHKILGRN